MPCHAAVTPCHAACCAGHMPLRLRLLHARVCVCVARQYLVVGDHEHAGVRLLQRVDGLGHVAQRVDVQARVDLVQDGHVGLHACEGGQRGEMCTQGIQRADAEGGVQMEQASCMMVRDRCAVGVLWCMAAIVAYLVVAGAAGAP